jgi:hypothetical protein
MLVLSAVEQPMRGLQLVVADADAARRELLDRA